jgi:hypothetical protein
VVYNYNANYSEGEGRRTEFKASLGKVSKTQSQKQNKSQALAVNACNTSQLGQIVHEIPISKITRPKWTGGVAQAVEPHYARAKP